MRALAGLTLGFILKMIDMLSVTVLLLKKFKHICLLVENRFRISP